MFVSIIPTQPSIELSTKIAEALDVSVDLVIGMDLGTASNRKVIASIKKLVENHAQLENSWPYSR